MVVVLPAPSGPIRPNISPGSTANDSSRTASVRPNRFVTRSSLMALLDKLDLRFDGHTDLQHALFVVHRHLDAIHELRAVLGSLNVPRRELRSRGNVADGAGQSV